MVRRSVLALAVAALLSSGLAAADVNGKWQGSVDTPDGPFVVTFVFKVEGETLTGSVASAMGETPLSNGKVKGDLMTFDVIFEGSTIVHEATSKGDNEILIKATGDWGTAEYTVTRVAEKPAGQ